MHRDEFRTIVMDAVSQSLAQSGDTASQIPPAQLQSLVTGIADGVFAALEATLDEGIADDFINLNQPNAADAAAAAAAAAANAAAAQAVSQATTRSAVTPVIPVTSPVTPVVASNLVEDSPARVLSRPTDDSERLLWRGRPYLTIGTIYELTSQRLRILRGIVSNSIEEIELVRVRDTGVTQTMGERMFDIGDIEIISNDRSKPRKILYNVRNPVDVRELIRQAVVDERERRGLIYREEMGDEEGGEF